MSEIYDRVVSSFAYLSIVVELSKGKELSGYDIQLHVRKFGLEVGAGTVYNQLDILENAGIVRAKPVRRKRSYKTVFVMTPKGMKEFKEFKRKWTKPIQYAYENIVGPK